MISMRTIKYITLLLSLALSNVLYSQALEVHQEGRVRVRLDAGDDITITTLDSILLSATTRNIDSLVWRTSGTGTITDSTAARTYYHPTRNDYLLDSIIVDLIGYTMGGKDTLYTSTTIYNSIPTISFSSAQPATIDQVSIIFQTKANTDTLWMNWGNNTTLVPIVGTTDQTKTSDYASNNTTYNIRIWGNFSKINKFSVNEACVTFGAMSNNIGKMTGLTYLFLRDCSGVATCEGSDIPTGLTYWVWYNLPNLTATVASADIPKGLTYWVWQTLPNLTVASADIPKGLTYWVWHTLPNLTATVASADIPKELTTWQWNNIPNLTATVASANIPTGLTFWQWYNLPNLTATVASANIPIGLTYWSWYNLPNLTVNGLSVTGLGKALTTLTASIITLSTARVDELLASMDAFYTGANLMTYNATITLNGTGVGAPTGGETNTNLVSLKNKATSQGKTWTFLINTP